MVRKKARKGNTKGKTLSIIMVLAVITFVSSLGFYLASRQAPNSEPKSLKEIVSGIVPSVKKAVVGVEDINLRQKSMDNQRAMDSILMQQSKWQLSDDGRKDMKEARTDAAGEITWTQRKLLIGIPYGDSLQNAAAWITEKVEANGFKVTDQSVVNYIDENAIALSIAMIAKVGKGEKELVFDQAIIFNGDQTNEKSMLIVKENKEKAKKAGKKYTGKMAVVVDDCGYDLGPVRALSRLPIEMAFAVIPFKANSSAALQIIRQNDQTAMLHLPMEPAGEASSETRYVKVGMSKADLEKLTTDAIKSLPGIKGVNNHQGSKATTDYSTMQTVLGVIKKQGLFFLDSRTSSDSLAEKLAGQMGIKTGRNNRYLDNSSSVGDIKAEILAAAATADKNGSVIVICHARPATAQAWEEIYKQLKDGGIKFVPVSELLI